MLRSDSYHLVAFAAHTAGSLLLSYVAQAHATNERSKNQVHETKQLGGFVFAKTLLRAHNSPHSSPSQTHTHWRSNRLCFASPLQAFQPINGELSRRVYRLTSPNPPAACWWTWQLWMNLRSI